jgi:uncharacterized protein GlcG (DUF336 family)
MTVQHLSLIQAVAIANATLQAGAELGFAPLTVVVLDKGGHVLALLRDERASLFRPQIAIAKASGCLGMGFGGRELANRAQAMPQFFTALNSIFPNGIVPVPGGVLIRNADGLVLGAVGVSGDTSDHDEVCAVRGIELVKLIGDTGTPLPDTSPSRS